MMSRGVRGRAERCRSYTLHSLSSYIVAGLCPRVTRQLPVRCIQSVQNQVQGSKRPLEVSTKAKGSNVRRFRCICTYCIQSKEKFTLIHSNSLSFCVTYNYNRAQAHSESEANMSSALGRGFRCLPSVSCCPVGCLGCSEG